VAALDADGNVLVTWEGEGTCGPGTIAARWFAPDGSPRTDVFVAAEGLPRDAGAWPWRILQLPDGSVALQLWNGRFVRRLQAGTPAAGPPPEWLSAFGGGRLERIRGGAAYAALYDDSACNPRIEIFSTAGESCGDVAYPPLAGVAPGASCDPSLVLPRGLFLIGRDGTVMRLADEGPCPGGTGECCTYEWWSRSLR
jgi:hypothetical protein